MRPLGHTEARAERDERVELHNALFPAWEAYRTYDAARDHAGSGDLAQYCRHAKDLLRPIAPSVNGLHHLILSLGDEPALRMHLGIFVTAGYSLTPDETIIYPLDTPYLDYIGYWLERKHLIVTGHLGNHTGEFMFGKLTIDGKVGAHAGRFMVGTLVNNGSACVDVGNYMAGILENRRRLRDRNVCCNAHHYPGPHDMVGRRDGAWNIREPFMEKFLYLFGKTPSWETARMRFLREIDHTKTPRRKMNHEFLEEYL